LELIISTVERKLDNEDFMRASCLFLVNLLVAEQIDMVFEYRSGLLVKKAIQWLDEFDNGQLFVASAVIIANYMRSGKDFFITIVNF
jgi:hypothetical protein